MKIPLKNRGQEFTIGRAKLSVYLIGLPQFSFTFEVRCGDGEWCFALSLFILAVSVTW